MTTVFGWKISHGQYRHRSLCLIIVCPTYLVILYTAPLTSSSMYRRPLSTLLTYRFGFRVVVISASVLVTGGYLLSSSATNIYMVLVGNGILVGIGHGLVSTPGMVVIANYFTDKFPLASALAYIGQPAGTVIMVQVATGLIRYFGWRGAYMIMAGLSLNMCLLGALLRPVDNVASPDQVTPVQEENENTGRGNNHCNRKWFDMKVLRSHMQWAMVLCIFLWVLPSSIMSLLLPDYAISHGVTKVLAAWTLSIMGCSSIFGSIVAGVLPNTAPFDRLLLLSGASLRNGVVALCVPSAVSFASLMVVSAIYGFFLGMQVAFLVPAQKRLFGTETVNSGYGLQMLGGGIGSIISPPIAGWLNEWNGDIRLPYFLTGGLAILSAVVYFAIYIWRRRNPV